MDVFFAVVIVIWVVVAVIVYVWTMIDDEGDENLLSFAFHIQCSLIGNLQGEVNDAGIIIVLVVVSLFTLPCNVLLIVAKAMQLLSAFLWRMFKRCFRAKND